MAVRDSKGRFTNNKNTWTVNGDIAYCFLGDELLFFTDAILYSSLSSYSFTKLARGYAGCRKDAKTIAVHRLIAEPKEDELVDHINRNKKDNRLCNLRNTNKSVNAFNCGLRITNKSGVTGVSFRKDTQKWKAEIKKNYQKISLGCYSSFEEAVEARRKAEEYYFGYQFERQRETSRTGTRPYLQ